MTWERRHNDARPRRGGRSPWTCMRRGGASRTTGAGEPRVARTSKAQAAVVKKASVRYVRVTGGMLQYHSSRDCGIWRGGRHPRGALPVCVVLTA